MKISSWFCGSPCVVGIVAATAAMFVATADLRAGVTTSPPPGTPSTTTTVTTSSGSTTSNTTPTSSGPNVIPGVSGKVYTVPSSTISTSGGSITVGATGNADPFISYLSPQGVQAVNSSDDFADFSFDFKIPIVAILGANDIEASLFGSLFAREGNTGLTSVSPFNQDFVQVMHLFDTGVGEGTWVHEGIDLGGFSATPGDYPPSLITTIDPPGPLPVGAFTGLELTLSFELSAHTEFDLQGSEQINGVPEPASIVLCLTLGAAWFTGASGRRWLRRRS